MKNMQRKTLGELHAQKARSPWGKMEREREGFYRRAYQALLRLFRAEGRRVRRAVEDAPDQILAAAAITVAVDEGRRELADTLRALYTVTVEHFGARTSSELGGEVFDPQTWAAMDWTEKHGLERSTLMTNTSKAEGRVVLREALAEGRAIRDVAKDLEKHYLKRAKQRATTAARTEIIGASNRGSITAARQSDVVTSKTWMDSPDRRVRESHDIADGQTVTLDEPFIVGGFELDHPGDFSEGVPGRLVINCRCVLTYGIE